MTLPALDSSQLDAHDGVSLEYLREACCTWGCLYLTRSPLGPAAHARMLAAAEAFFALPDHAKGALHISRSPRHRGYSELRSSVDFREQIHFGPELLAPRAGAAALGSAPADARLEGPNLWPAALGAEWRATLLAWLGACVELGRKLLVLVARAFGLPEPALLELSHPRPYALMKLMRYAPRQDAPEPRTGMAAHCDFSLLTLLLQSVHGLQIQTPQGAWVGAPALSGSLLVTFGELLEVASGGRIRATPHRVLTAGKAPRLSVPVFINPDLRRTVAPLLEPRARSLRGLVAASPGEVHEHVHRVLVPEEPLRPLAFGESEWRRKGLGQWCFRAECIAAAREREPEA